MKKIVSVCMSLILCFYFVAFSFSAYAYSIVDVAIEWAVEIANNNIHGYDQHYRYGPDYDCSSLVISAFKYAGANVGDANTTRNMLSEMGKNDFIVFPFEKSNLQRGDILWVNGHTELYLGDNFCVGAHCNENKAETGGLTGDQTGNEISVAPYWNDGWTHIIRYQSHKAIESPTEGWIWSDKKTIAVGETISFNFNAINANKFVLGIYKDGVFQPIIDNGASDWYTTSFNEAGQYSIHAVCYNELGHCDSPELEFTVFDPDESSKKDLNADGEFSIADAVLLSRFLSEDNSIPEYLIDRICTFETDLNLDGVITIADVYLFIDSIL